MSRDERKEVFQLILARVPMSLIRDCAMQTKMSDSAWLQFQAEYDLLEREEQPKQKQLYFGPPFASPPMQKKGFRRG